MLKPKKIYLVIAVICAWYVFVRFFMPNFGYAQPAFSFAGNCDLKQFTMKPNNYTNSYEGMKSKFKELAKHKYYTLCDDGNALKASYGRDKSHLLILSGKEDYWKVIAVPSISSEYIEPFWKRILFLDFRKHNYPIRKISSDDMRVLRVER